MTVDGTSCAPALLIRPIRETDQDRLLRFHSRLSSQTTYYRFFGVHPHLSQAEVTWFTHVDHADREALVAVCDAEIVGVARYDRVDGSDEAEVAIVVQDDWQSRGVGRRLFAALCGAARAHGVRTLVADVLAANSRVLRLFDASGLPRSKSLDGGVIHVRMPLDSDRGRHRQRGACDDRAAAWDDRP